MIAILDYGIGNLGAFYNLYSRLNIPVSVVSDSDKLKSASKIILPGVGAFDWAMSKLHKSGMFDTLNTLVIENKIPILGVCSGMQLMANRSEEGRLPGLSWIDGEVVSINASSKDSRVILPHMGWNDVIITKNSGLFVGMESSRYYFLHSFYFKARLDSDVLAVTDYGSQFPAAIGRSNIFGVQFHPEKSHSWGIKLLKNFAEMKFGA